MNESECTRADGRLPCDASAILTNFALGIEWVPERWRPSLAAFFFSCSAMGEFMMVLVAVGVALLHEVRAVRVKFHFF